ncbi:hypothetical protein [Flagellimonas algicola]|uniref:3-keto-disaccharide hydrolase domain-containing protein n=1 Tax=Flagellimonas algicola TaxID=2583815 RepID=A0ABY2WRK3_9FLAO|nr:hypothetical protein [Allomuricauda algicola]TMU57296.1 hypothetical protein FGG15_07060 [Allomuricauda algicola]
MSKIISEASNISISPHTLKRLFGKIEYSKFYNPQRATKDALAKYLGYTDWMAFSAFYKEKVGSETEPQPKNYKMLKLAGLLSLGLVLIWVLVQSFISNNLQATLDETSPFSFELKDGGGSVPYTASVSYNIETQRNDSSYIDFDFKHPVYGQQVFKLNKEQFLYNYTYQIPGYYNIKLLNNRRILATRSILATSDNWDSYLNYEAKLKLWLDNELPPAKKLGYMTYPSDSLIKNGYDVKSVYYTTHRFFNRFGVDGDNFEMEVRFKNSKETGGITCYDFITRLYGEENLVYLKLMETGCSGYSGIKIGETEVTGAKENLEGLTFLDERWNILRLEVKNQKVYVFINDQLIYSDIYEGKNGSIVGIEHVFKGSGILDYVRLKDGTTQREFFDDFDE